MQAPLLQFPSGDVTSEMECAQRCSLMGCCKAFTYSLVDGDCSLHPLEPESSDVILVPHRNYRVWKKVE